jgi:hypothetical protein
VQVAAGEQPIRLVHAGVDVHAEGSLVHTVIDLALSNPNARVLAARRMTPGQLARNAPTMPPAAISHNGLTLVRTHTATVAAIAASSHGLP